MTALLLLLAAAPADQVLPALVLDILCRHYPKALPRQVARAARRAHVPADLMAATVGAESTCDNRKISRKGAIGFGQLLPGGSAAKHHPAKQLRRVGLNLRLTAEHLAKGLRLCGGSWSQAVAFYSGVWPCQATTWSERVMEAVEKARPRIEMEGR